MVEYISLALDEYGTPETSLGPTLYPQLYIVWFHPETDPRSKQFWVSDRITFQLGR